MHIFCNTYREQSHDYHNAKDHTRIIRTMQQLEGR